MYKDSDPIGVVRWSRDCGHTWNAGGPRIIWPTHGVSRQVVVTAIRSERTGQVLVPTDHWGRGSSPYNYCFSQQCDQTVIQHVASIDQVTNTSAWSLAPIGAADSTYGAGYNHTGSHHSAIVELRNGSFLAIGRGHAIEGKMPIALSEDGGYHWRASASPFPPIHGGQRAVMIRLGRMEAPLLLCSFANEAGVFPFPSRGLYCAISHDEGSTWASRKVQSLNICVQRMHTGSICAYTWGSRWGLAESKVRLHSGSGLEAEESLWVRGEHLRLSARPTYTCKACMHPQVITTDSSVRGHSVKGTDGEPFTMAYNSSEPDGYTAATVDQSGSIHLITSRNHYTFNAAWVMTPTPAPPSTTGMGPQPTDPRIYAERRRRNWCGPSHEVQPLQGLDDAKCTKTLPPTFDRQFQCPNMWPDAELVGFDSAGNNASELKVHAELSRLVPPNTAIDAKVAVGVIRRRRAGTAAYVRWLGNGAERREHQPWSSSKVFAAAHAASKLRAMPILRGELGLDASEDGVPLGDLLTVMAAYDVNSTRPGVTSNAVAAYYQSLGGHMDANAYLHSVIGGTGAESFGGDYGERVPATLSRTLVAASGEAVNVTEDPSRGIPNRMSCLTMAAWLRRIICVRDGERLLSWDDSAALLYGATDSVWFPGLQWGGLSMGTDVYLQEGIGVDVLRRRSPDWRIFSKLGAGISSSDHPSRFEITLNAYGCFPLSNGGLEFVLSAAVVGGVGVGGGDAADAAMRSLVHNVTAWMMKRYDRRSKM